MKVLTKISIGAGALAPVIGGLGWYMATRSDKPLSLDYDALWNGRLKALEDEMKKLKKEGNGKESELARKISEHGDIFFSLRSPQGGFDPEDATQQRSELNKFCLRTDKERVIDATLSKKICG